jgi:glycosyltransferase involved in cell wall biosynthesis
MKYPLVSCVCVTNRIVKVEQAIKYFSEQSYENKELVVVSQECDLKLLATKLNEEGKLSQQIKLIQIPASPKISLGELRNISIEKSEGEYFCQWDDDDWYHKDRIKLQLMAALENSREITMLANLLIFDELKQNAYITRSALWEPSIFCKKDIITEKVRYPSLSKSEDSEFVEALPKTMIQSVFVPYLYIYIYHGKNTWDETHFNKMFFRGQKLNNETSALISNILANKYTHEEASNLIQSINFAKEIERITIKWYSEPGYCSGPHQ